MSYGSTKPLPKAEPIKRNSIPHGADSENPIDRNALADRRVRVPFTCHPISGPAYGINSTSQKEDGYQMSQKMCDPGDRRPSPLSDWRPSLSDWRSLPIENSVYEWRISWLNVIVYSLGLFLSLLFWALLFLVGWFIFSLRIS